MDWTLDGTTYEADQRHVEIILRDLGLVGKVKTTPIPYEKWITQEIEYPAPDLVGPAATLYRAVVARATYLSQDRSDIRYAVTELCRSMSEPTERDLEKHSGAGTH